MVEIAHDTILSHFADADFKFNPRKKWNTSQLPWWSSKPEGMWLSNEGAFGWSAWCKSECYAGLKFGGSRFDFHVDWARILILDSLEKIEALPTCEDIGHCGKRKVTDWPVISETHAGVYMEGNQDVNFRKQKHLIWCRMWDCASACVWDISAIKPVEKETTSNRPTTDRIRPLYGQSRGVLPPASTQAAD